MLRTKDYFKVLESLQKIIFSVPIIAEMEGQTNVNHTEFLNFSEELKAMERQQDGSLARLNE